MSFVPTDLILLPIGHMALGGGGRKPTRSVGPVSHYCEPFTCYCGAEKSKVFLFPIMIADRNDDYNNPRYCVDPQLLFYLKVIVVRDSVKYAKSDE
jgi:hypothetical protein